MIKNIKITSILVSVILMQACSSSDNQIIWVGGIKTECSSGAGKMLCLNVAKGESLADQNWETFYNPIKGFEFEEGWMKQIEVKEEEEEVESPQADRSSVQYTFIREIQRQVDIRAKLEGSWQLVKINEAPINKMVKVPELQVRLNTREIAGSGGCNIYAAKINKLSSEQIKFSEAQITKRACIAKNIEQKYFNALMAADNYQITDDLLTIFDANRQSVLSFLKQNISEKNKGEGMEVAGGWSAAEVDQYVDEALSFMLKQINPSSKLNKILHVKKQVVKGMNYDLSIELDNGEIWNAIIYRDLTGELSFLKEPEKVKQ